MKKFVVCIAVFAAFAAVSCGVQPAQAAALAPQGQTSYSAAADVRPCRRVLRVKGGRRTVQHVLRRFLPRMKRAGKNVRFFVRSAHGSKGRYFMYGLVTPARDGRSMHGGLF